MGGDLRILETTRSSKLPVLPERSAHIRRPVRILNGRTEGKQASIPKQTLPPGVTRRGAPTPWKVGVLILHSLDGTRQTHRTPWRLLALASTDLFPGPLWLPMRRPWTDDEDRQLCKRTEVHVNSEGWR